MKAFGLTRSRAVVILALVGCSGLDPQRFAGGERTGSLGGQAGYAFDAGLGGPAGAAGTGSASRPPTAAGKGGTTSGSGGDATEGEGGAPQEADGGAPPEPTSGDGGRGDTARGGGSSGVAGARSGGGAGASGRGGTANAGATGSGGSSGVGGAGGDAGSAGSEAAGSAGSTPLPAAHAFFFSEYVEGSASFKALELLAQEASVLDGCQLVTYSNGSATGGSIALSGAVAAGDVYTLCSTTLAALLGDACDRATNLIFNGDDAVALECEGATIDVIGRIGEDPGTAWTGPSGSTVNATLRRRCDHALADPDGTDPFDPDVAFTPLPVDTFDGLGDPACG